MISALFAFFVGAVIALYTTPLMRAAALKFGIVDKPDGKLKRHAEPVPYLGGLAVYLAFLVSLAAVYDFTHPVLGILLAGTLMVLVGLIDDLGVLSPWEKLAGQFIAVGVLIKAGLFVQLEFFPHGLALAISVLWLIVVTNAFNILDIMDGLAGGVAAIGAACLSAIAIVNDKPEIAAMGAALAGSLVGFLRFNAPPARIYLGDSGSLFIGMTLAALALNGRYTTENWVGMATPIVVLGVPLFDLSFVSLIRLEKGVAPWRGSPDHFPLRLRRAGLSVGKTITAAYFAALVASAVGLVIMSVDSPSTAALWVSATAIVALCLVFALRRTGG